MSVFLLRFACNNVAYCRSVKAGGNEAAGDPEAFYFQF
jgi:hypothetical protein